jgi:hypothetical protein
MPDKLNSAVVEAMRLFVDSEPYYEGLWNGLYVLLMDYLSGNADVGLGRDIGGIFFDDLNALMELIWVLHEIESHDENSDN